MLSNVRFDHFPRIPYKNEISLTPREVQLNPQTPSATATTLVHVSDGYLNGWQAVVVSQKYTVKILIIGTPEIISVNVLKFE